MSQTSKQKAQQKLSAMQGVFGAVEAARNQQSLDKAMSGIQFQQNAGYLQMAEQLQCAGEQRKFEPLWSNSNVDLSARRWKDDRLGSGQVNAFLVKRQNKLCKFLSWI
jgi:hypothetical protein